MKHYYKDILVHGAQIVRYLKGQHESDDYKLNLVAKLPLAVANSAARTLSKHRRAEQSEDDDDLEDFLASLGGTYDELGGDGNELGGGDFDLLSAFGGGLGGGDDELGLGGGGLDFFSAFGFGGEDGNAMGGFGDDHVLSDIMENMEQCGIDIPDMTSKVFEAIMSGAGGFDFTSPDFFQSAGPTILLALKDEDEEDCDGADTAEVLLASEEFFQCSGMNKFFGSIDFQDNESLALMQSIEGVCKPVFDMVMNNAEVEVLMEGDLDEDSELGGSVKNCLQILLGDNPVGNTIRYQYHHLDTMFGCVSKFGDSLPHCLLNSPPSDEGTVISMPLSLEKKLDCIVGASYEGLLEEMCMGILGALDDCLPSCHETVDDQVSSVYNSCTQEEGMGVMFAKSDFLFGIDTSVIDNNQMPEFCSKIFKKKGVETKDIQSRLDNFNLGRSYGWTLDSITTDIKVGVETPQESPEGDKEFIISMESSALPQGIYKSNPEDISQVESTEWSNGEAELSETESTSAKSSFFVFMMAGVVVIALTALALIFKHTRDRVGGQQKYQLPSDLALKIDGHDIA